MTSVTFPKYGTITVSLDTVAELSAFKAVKLFDGLHAIVRCQTVANDGLGGIFTFDASSTDTPNGTTMVAVTGVAVGRWIKTVRSVTGQPGQTGPVGPTGDVTPAALTAAQSASASAIAADAARQAVAGLKEAVEAAAASKPFAIAVGTGEAIFDTIGVAKLASIPASVTVITTRGFYSPGDGGGATYRRVNTANTDAYFAFRSADRLKADGSTDAVNGGYWEYVLIGNKLNIRQLGAQANYVSKNNRGRDNYPILLAAMNYQPVAGYGGPDIHLDIGVYYCSQTLEPHNQFKLLGAGMRGNGGATGFARTWIMMPLNTKNMQINGGGQTGTTGRDQAGIGSCASSKIVGITFMQETDANSLPGTDLTAHALDMRTAIHVEDCTFVSIAGDGFHVEAFTDGGGRYGEASNWISLHNFAHSVGGHGHFAAGADANIGYCEAFTTQVAGLCGIYDTAYFVNVYNSPHLAGYGTEGVFHQGKNWSLIGINRGGTYAPGQDTQDSETTWYYRGTASAPSTRFPQWVSGTNYKMKGPVYASGNATFTGVYIEGGGSYGYAHAPMATIIGPDMGWTHYSTVLGQGITSAQIGMIRGNGGDPSNPVTPHIGDAEFTLLGAFNPEFPSSQLRRRLLMYHRSGNDQVELGYSQSGRGRNIQMLVNTKPVFSFSAQDGTMKYGRPGPVRSIFTAHDMGLQDPNDAGNMRLLGIRDQNPTTRSGYYARGERYFYTHPAPGQTDYWVCTQAGAISQGNWSADYFPLGATLVSNGQMWVVTKTATGYSTTAPTGTGTFIDPVGGMTWEPVGTTPPIFQTITVPARNSVTYDPASIAAGASVTTVVPCTGSYTGRIADAVTSIDPGALIVTAFAQDNQVVVRYTNPTAADIDMASHTLSVSTRSL